MSDRPQGVRPTMEELLEEYAPANYDEASTAARAIHEAREDEAAYVALEGLTEFERHLAQAAYDAGRRHEREAIEAAIGKAAVTLSADALRDEIAWTARRTGITFRRGSHRFEDMSRLGPADLRAARLVQGARRAADHHTEPVQEPRP